MIFCCHWVEWIDWMKDSQACLSVSFISKQNFSEERLNSQKLIWFYLLEIFHLSTIIFLPNFVASNYQKIIADIWIIFVSYSFYIGLPLFWSLDPCPPKILDASLCIGLLMKECCTLDYRWTHWSGGACGYVDKHTSIKRVLKFYCFQILEKLPAKKIYI